MSEKKGDLTTRAIEAATPHLPPFCTVVRGVMVGVFDPKAKGKKRTELGAYFTFPGATDYGFWRSDLPEMAMLDADDYETYQRLKDQWHKEKGNDERT